MFSGNKLFRAVLALLVCLAAATASAQSFRVQCPPVTSLHPSGRASVPYTGPTTRNVTVKPDIGGPFNVPYVDEGGAIKCQQISGGDGFATMADGTQTYLFAFGPLSGLSDMANGLPGTQPNTTFNVPFDPLAPAGTPASNGAVGLIGDPNVLAGVAGGATAVAQIALTGNQVGAVLGVTVTNGGSGYIAPPSVTFSPPQTPGGLTALGQAMVSNGAVTAVTVTFTGVGYTSPPAVIFGPASNGCAGPNPPSQCLTGHVDPRQIMNVAIMNGNIPAPLMAIDEDDEFFLTLTNVGMIMRPDLFEQHTIHFHGYPNASNFYDGVPDASVAINIGGSFTYYYLAPEAGTYFWHCHITPPEHLQMGMVGQLYVRPRQNRVPVGNSLYSSLFAQQSDLRIKCGNDILCAVPLPPANGVPQQVDSLTGKPYLYAYNDGDGSTRYDVEYPLQMHGFDPNFHFVGMTFNPEGFVDMKDKYFLLNGRSYPDTIRTSQYVDPGANPGQNVLQGVPAVSPALYTQSTDGVARPAQPLNSLIRIPFGGRALLRISCLDVTEYQTLASVGIPMEVIALNARLLRDEDGNNLYYNTNSITLAGGESLDVILDATDTNKYPRGSSFFLYTPQLDHLSNDAENFGGLMTEVVIQ